MCWPKEALPTNAENKATRFWVCKCEAIQIRVFHITWITFWLCFFGWFGTANLAQAITEDLGLTTKDKAYAGGCAVASTVFFRLLFGWLCDKIGARYSYTILLLISGIPICLVSLVQTNVEYIIVHIFIGITGASFVITQYHTTQMFAGNVVGVANATTAGFGNFGGGCANFLMPLFMSAIMDNHDIASNQAWRYTMLIPGLSYFFVAAIYFFFTKDTPKGNINVSCIKKQKTKEKINIENKASVQEAMCDYRTWILFIAYAGSFGIELTILRFATLYFQHEFDLTPKESGSIILCFTLTNLFGRPIGGAMTDCLSNRFKSDALQTRVKTLVVFLIGQSIFIVFFAASKQVDSLIYAVVTLFCFSMFVESAEGATFAIVPFVCPDSNGPVSGIVGAGGNVGAVLFAFALFAYVPDNISYEIAWYIVAAFVFFTAIVSLTIKFSEQETRIAVAKMKEIGNDEKMHPETQELTGVDSHSEMAITPEIVAHENQATI